MIPTSGIFIANCIIRLTFKYYLQWYHAFDMPISRRILSTVISYHTLTCLYPAEYYLQWYHTLTCLYPAEYYLQWYHTFDMPMSCRVLSTVISCLWHAYILKSIIYSDIMLLTCLYPEEYYLQWYHTFDMPISCRVFRQTEAKTKLTGRIYRNWTVRNRLL